MAPRLLVKVASVSFSAHPVLRAELLRKFPRAEFNRAGARLAGGELAAFLKGARAAVIGLERIDDALLRACPDLKTVVKYGVGLDNVDHDACARRGVGLFAPQGVNKSSVAELAVGFMLALCRNFFHTAVKLKGGVWHKDGGCELGGKTVGIVGVGHIGKEVVRLLRPFGCRILVNDVVEQDGFYRRNGCREVSKAELFKRSDVVTLHTPLTEKTRGLVDLARLRAMKRSAFLVNTARGPLVVQADLKKALKSGLIAGAALDVYEEEPPQDRELLGLHNLIATPHIGGNSREAVLGMGRWAIGRLESLYGK